MKSDWDDLKDMDYNGGFNVGNQYYLVCKNCMKRTPITVQVNQTITIERCNLCGNGSHYLEEC